VHIDIEKLLRVERYRVFFQMALQTRIERACLRKTVRHTLKVTPIARKMVRHTLKVTPIVSLYPSVLI
jgi:hypothetical protein